MTDDEVHRARTLEPIATRHALQPGHGPGGRKPLIEAVVAVAACAMALMVAASAGSTDRIASSTFGSAGIECAPSPGATGQVFLNANATPYEIITARLAIASVPGVTIDQYLDHQRALTQLSCVFADSLDILQSTHPSDLPVSFTITADTGSTAHLQALPNVRGVVTPDSWSGWWIDWSLSSAGPSPAAA